MISPDVNPNVLLAGFELAPTFDRDSVHWDKELGFMTVHPEAVAIRGIKRLVGFAVPYLPSHDTPQPDLNDEVEPVTDFDMLPCSLQTVDHLSKGVGPRLGNVWQVAQSGSDVPDGRVGVYTLDVPLNGIYDRRPTQGGRARQIVRHLIQRVEGQVIARVIDPETATRRVVNKVHAMYGDASVVRMNIPPNGIAEMQAQGLKAPDGVVPGFVIVRSQARNLIRVGVPEPDRS